MSSLFKLFERYIWASVLLGGVIFCGLAAWYYFFLKIYDFYVDLFLNIGAGFIGSALTGLILQPFIEKQKLHNNSEKKARLEQETLQRQNFDANVSEIVKTVCEDAHVLNTRALSEFGALLLKEINVLAPFELEVIQRRFPVIGKINTTYVEQDSLALISVYTENQKFDNGIGKDSRLWIDTMSLTSNVIDLERIVCYMIQHLNDFFKNKNDVLLPNTIIAAPKSGNPILAAKIAERLGVRCIFFTERDKYAKFEYFEGPNITSEEVILIQDIIESGRRLEDLAKKIRKRYPHANVKYAFCYVKRSDPSMANLLEDLPTLEITPIHTLDEKVLRSLKKKYPRNEYFAKN